MSIVNVTNAASLANELSKRRPGTIIETFELRWGADGEKVEGPGGDWIPCATKMADGTYYSGLFQVGPGKRQVCAASLPLRCPNEALSRAIELASSAAA